MGAFYYVVSLWLKHASRAWEYQIARRLLASVDSYAAFLIMLKDGDVNTRVFLMNEVLGRIGHLLSTAELGEMRHRLDKLKGDVATHESTYGHLQCEEDEVPLTVAKAAVNALAAVESAWGCRAHGGGRSDVEKGE